MRRIFVPLEQLKDDTITVTGDDVGHIRDVLRMKTGDEITATAGRGITYRCKIKEVSRDSILLDIKDEIPDESELPVKLSLYQALPKQDKMELVVQKAVELGVYEIIPVRTARCVVKFDEAKSSKKKERWQRIAEEAAKQSGRGIVPEVFSVMNMDDAIAHAASSDIILIPYELCEDHQTIEELRLSVRRGAASIAVFIGPEGGFETGEVDAVANAGGRVISLGHRILRTETAAIAVLANLMFMIEEAASKTVNSNE